ncbi:hypothetical protein ACFE04_001316 [Oxalis oulophora]
MSFWYCASMFGEQLLKKVAAKKAKNPGWGTKADLMDDAYLASYLAYSICVHLLPSKESIIRPGVCKVAATMAVPNISHFLMHEDSSIVVNESKCTNMLSEVTTIWFKPKAYTDLADNSNFTRMCQDRSL